MRKLIWWAGFLMSLSVVGIGIAGIVLFQDVGSQVYYSGMAGMGFLLALIYLSLYKRFTS